MKRIPLSTVSTKLLIITLYFHTLTIYAPKYHGNPCRNWSNWYKLDPLIFGSCCLSYLIVHNAPYWVNVVSATPTLAVANSLVKTTDLWRWWAYWSRFPASMTLRVNWFHGQSMIIAMLFRISKRKESLTPRLVSHIYIYIYMMSVNPSVKVWRNEFQQRFKRHKMQIIISSDIKIRYS